MNHIYILLLYIYIYYYIYIYIYLTYLHTFNYLLYKLKERPTHVGSRPGGWAGWVCPATQCSRVLVCIGAKRTWRMEIWRNISHIPIISPFLLMKFDEIGPCCWSIFEIECLDMFGLCSWIELCLIDIRVGRHAWRSWNLCQLGMSQMSKNAGVQTQDGLYSCLEENHVFGVWQS